MRRINERAGRVLLACLLSSVMPLSAADDAVILNPADSIVDGESVRVQSTSTGSGAHP